QAEDGIRDGHVTGVQTSALPISFERLCRQADGKVYYAIRLSTEPLKRLRFATQSRPQNSINLSRIVTRGCFSLTSVPALAFSVRSEERRVGKRLDMCGWRM